MVQSQTSENARYQCKAGAENVKTTEFTNEKYILAGTYSDLVKSVKSYMGERKTP
jgi:hypothetical protein